MTIQWVKAWDDGRRQLVHPDPDSIDYSKQATTIEVEKVTRQLAQNEQVLHAMRLPDLYGMDSDYRAIDAKIFPGLEGYGGETAGKKYLYVAYASKPATGVKPKPPYKLYFAKFNLTDKVTVFSDVELTASVDPAQRVAVNRYQNGTVWVVYGSSGGAIASRTSTDGGNNWGNLRIIYETGYKYLFHEQDYANMKVTKSGTWKTVSIPRFYGGSALRSSGTSGARWLEYTFTGTDSWIYTFSTKDVDSSGKRMVGVVDFYVDGKYQHSVDLSKYSIGYKHKVQVNRSRLANKTHRVRLVHRTGKYFWFDAVVNRSESSTYFRFNDAIIRQGSGVSETEALVFYTLHDDTPKKGRRSSMIAVDRSGNATHWGTKYIKEYVFLKNYATPLGGQGMFAEDERGLWLIVQRQTYVNGPCKINHYLFEGSDGTITNYGRSQWSLLAQRPPSKNVAIRYTAGSSLDGSFCVMVTSFRGERYRNESVVPPAAVSYSANLEFPGVYFPLVEANTLPVLAVNYPPSTPNTDPAYGSVGLLTLDRDGVATFKQVSFTAKTAMLRNVSDYVSDYEISHDNTSEASSLNLNVLDDTPYRNRREFENFYKLLPSSYSDRDTRIVRVTAKFDQGSYWYEARIFTGIIGEVRRTYKKGDTVISLSAYDYSMWLQRFNPPYYLIYASPKIDWGEMANDYSAPYAGTYFSAGKDNALAADPYGGDFRRLPVRNEIREVVKDDDGKVVDTIYQGWRLKKSESAGSFAVDTVEGKILQSGAGYLTSPAVGFASHYVSAEFTVPENEGHGWFDVGFRSNLQLNTMDAVKGLARCGAFVRFRLYDSKVKLYFVEKDKAPRAVASKSFRIHPGVTYRVVAYSSSSSVRVSVTPLRTQGLTSVTLGAELPHKTTIKNHKQMYIGSQTALFGSIKWDNILLFSAKDGRQLKYDHKVANDMVAKAFQGIIPFQRYDKDNSDYFTSIIVNPQVSIKESLDQLAAQNSKKWYFDYNGTLVWEHAEYDDPTYTLTDDDLEDMAVSFNQLNSVNWVEAVDGRTIPQVRLSISEPQSILSHGIRFVQVSSDDIKRYEQAKRLALGEYYKQGEHMESISISLTRPLLHLEPGTFVKVESENIRSVDDHMYGYSKIYCVTSVSISNSGGSFAVNLELSSRAKAMFERVAQIYEERGVADFNG